MITKNEMFPLLLDACPDFVPEWEAFLAEWKDEDDLPLYLALGDLARHLVAKLEAGDEVGLSRVFAVVEKLVVHGDPYVSEAAVIGLLEDLQNANLHTKTEPEDFRPFLHPQSERLWDKLTTFWEQGAVLRDG